MSVPSASKALHVTAISWTNDSLMTADVWVAKGLSVTFDTPPTSSLTNAEFVVTLETIFDPFHAVLSSRAFNPQLPSTYIRTCSALDSTITVNGATVSWTMPYLKAPRLQVLTVNAINSGLLFGAELGQYGRVRVRVPSLVLPHPRMHERAFVLRPLIDVAPTTTIPGHGLARRLIRNVRGQRVAPTRTHVIH